jgi:hypothetical protein
VSPIFLLAVAASLAALTLLALPIMDVARDTVRLRAPEPRGTPAVASGSSSQLEVERSVRARLYGERTKVAATPRRSI